MGVDTEEAASLRKKLAGTSESLARYHRILEERNPGSGLSGSELAIIGDNQWLAAIERRRGRPDLVAQTEHSIRKITGGRDIRVR